MTSKKALKFFEDHNCQLAELDGEVFVIVDGWNAVKAPGFEAALKSAKADYGFSDEYTTCSDCGAVIRTSPDSYCWQPDFWVGDGEILCSDCVKADPEDYLTAQIDHRDSNHVVNERLIDLSKHGFVKVLTGLENGFHPGQADDPTRVRKFLEARGYGVAFTIEPSQFYVSFDVWVRACDVLQTFEISPADIDGLRTALGANEDYGHDFIANEFRESPDLATRTSAALKNLKW